MRRLAYVHLTDFIPGVEPYDVATVVELHPDARGVRMVLTVDAMHDELWTQRSVMGWESELGKLAPLLESRASRNPGGDASDPRPTAYLGLAATGGPADYPKSTRP